MIVKDFFFFVMLVLYRSLILEFRQIIHIVLHSTEFQIEYLAYYSIYAAESMITITPLKFVFLSRFINTYINYY